MKFVILFVTLGLSGFLGAQSLSEADRLFDRFEYGAAARTYEEVAKSKKLDVESRKKLAYSYYAIGDYAKCFPVVDSLVQGQDIEPFFYYMHGNVAMEQGKYDVSKASFEKYRSKDDEFNVEILIRSCDSLKVWKPNDKIKVYGQSDNISKADINGSNLGKRYFIFREAGVDSVGLEMNKDLVDMGELLLSRATLIEEEVEPLKVPLPADYKLASITSAANIPGTEKFLITLTQPSSKNEMLRVPHLYEATYDKLTGFNTINPWAYSGIEDSTSCGYATINTGGTMVVFSKQGKNTKGADLYLSKRTGDSWSKPESVAVLNTEMDEMAPMFSGDSLLTFASNGRPGYGGLDLFSVKLDGNNFGEIEHLKAPVNSYRDDLNLTWINDSVALFTSNRSGGKGDDDVYSAYFEKEKLPVTDTVNHELEEYLSNWTDKVILFDYDKYTIKDQKMIEEIADALKKIKGLEIVIEGHTDSRGVEIYNLELGRQRALTVRNEFIKLGVQDSSIETISKGEEEAIVDCSKGCSEEQHQQNRVAIIKIKKN